VELTGGGGLEGLEAFDRAFEATPKPKAASTVASTDGGQGMAEKKNLDASEQEKQAKSTSFQISPKPITLSEMGQPPSPELNLSTQARVQPFHTSTSPFKFP